MNWYRGSIQEAVTASKKNKSFFVVYIEGSDELSLNMTKVLDSVTIAQKFELNNFVAIKLVKDSEGHKQFEAFYKLVPVPSVFFIDQNGSPVEIVVSDISEDNILLKLNNAIQKCVPENKSNEAILTSPSMPSTSSSPTSGTSPSTSAGPSQQTSQDKMDENIESVPNQGINLNENKKKEDTEKVESLAPRNPSAEDIPVEERVEKAKILIEKKKDEKMLEERKKEKEAELERRRVGQEMQLAKRDQQDRELRQLKEERERAKKEESLARQRILEQIQQDRAERAERSAMLNNISTGAEESGQSRPEVVQSQPPVLPTSSVTANSGRLQFKLPTGETKSHSFPDVTTLSQVREFIDNNIVLPFSQYQLATTFPRREFTAKDNNRDLRTLRLVPSAVILILPVHGSLRTTSPGWANVIIDMFWSLVQPVISLSTYISNIVFGRNASNGGGGTSDRSEPTDSSSPPTSARSQSYTQRLGGRSTIRKRGNVYSLQDTRDDNDDNNTWNGNSTEQM